MTDSPRGHREDSGRDSDAPDRDRDTGRPDRAAGDQGRDSRAGAPIEAGAGERQSWADQRPTERLHPRVRLVWVARAVLSAAVVGVSVTLANRAVLGLGAWLPAAVALAVLVGGSALALARYRAWRYEVREDALYLERGVITRVHTVVPFVRIQHVDSSRGPIERAVGLASTVVYTAGSRGADVTIPGLSPAGSDDLQDRLKRLAIRSEGEDAV